LASRRTSETHPRSARAPRLSLDISHGDSAIGALARVAQIFNLVYGRTAFINLLERRLASGLQIRDTAESNSAPQIRGGGAL